MAREKGLNWYVEIPKVFPADYSATPFACNKLLLNWLQCGEIYCARTNRIQSTRRGQTITALSVYTPLGVPLAEQEAIFDEFINRAYGYTRIWRYGAGNIALPAHCIHARRSD
jgi:hypothetical protein